MRKTYDKQYMKYALQYYKDHPELSILEVCQHLDISGATFYRWSHEAKAKERKARIAKEAKQKGK